MSHFSEMNCVLVCTGSNAAYNYNTEEMITMLKKNDN